MRRRRPARTAGPSRMRRPTAPPAQTTKRNTPKPVATAPQANALHRNVRRISSGGKTYAFTRKSGDTRTVTRANGVRTAVFKDKQSGATLTRVTKRVDGKKVTTTSVSGTPPEAKKKNSSPATPNPASEEEKKKKGKGSGGNSSTNPGY